MLKKREDKQIHRFAMVLITVALLLGAVPLSTPVAAATADGGNALPTIAVTGSAQLNVAPDVAYLQFGVLTEEKTVEKANELNREKMAAVRKVLAPFQLKDEEMKTVYFETYPQYSWKDEVRTLEGYRVNHTLQLTIRDLEQVGPILDAVQQAGANQVDSVRFGTEKGDAYELQVLAAAMKNAEAKAETIAKALQGKLIGVESVSYQVPGYSPIMRGAYAKEMAMDAMGMPATEISVGQLEVTSEVQVVYQFQLAK